MIVVLAVVLAWIAAYSLLFREVGAEVSTQLTFSGVPEGMARWLGWIAGLATTGVILRYGAGMVLGTASTAQIIAVLGSAVLLVLAVQIARRDWLFDEHGQALFYLCPPVVAGDAPRLQGDSQDRVTGDKCPVVDRPVATVLPLIRRGRLPQQVNIRSAADLDLLPKFDDQNGGVLLFEGVADSSGQPRLYRNAGYDRFGGGLLRPVSAERLAAIRTWLVERDAQARDTQTKLDNALAQKEKAAARREAAEREKREQAERKQSSHALTRATTALALQLGMSAPPELADSPNAGIRALTKSWPLNSYRPFETSISSNWRQFFHERDPVPSAIYFFAFRPDVSSAMLGRIAEDLASGIDLQPSTRIARPSFFSTLDLRALVLGDNQALRSTAFPPNLSRLIVVTDVRQPVAGNPDLIVEWLDFDLQTRLARRRERWVVP